MKRSFGIHKRRARLVLVLSGAVTVVGSWFCRAQDLRSSEITVNAGDIGRRVQVIGLLGHPLGEMIDIRGHWRSPAPRSKERSLRFHVTEVNGQPIDRPVEFFQRDVQVRKENPKPAHGAVWELRGIETGSFRGLPAPVYRAEIGLEEEGPCPVADPWGHTFITQIVAAKYRVLKNGN